MISYLVFVIRAFVLSLAGLGSLLSVIPNPNLKLFCCCFLRIDWVKPGKQNNFFHLVINSLILNLSRWIFSLCSITWPCVEPWKCNIKAKIIFIYVLFLCSNLPFACFLFKKTKCNETICELCWAAERKGSQKGQHTSNSINPIYCYLYTMDKNFSMFQYTEWRKALNGSAYNGHPKTVYTGLRSYSRK